MCHQRRSRTLYNSRMREIPVFKGRFDTVLGHAIGKSGDTERYNCSRRAFGAVPKA
jgi:hypothetical protein